jgi:hypothetical protein
LPILPQQANSPAIWPLRRLAKRREHPFTVNFEYFLSLVSTFVKSVRIAAFGDTADDLYICIKCAAVLPIDVLWETAIFSIRESANGLTEDQATPNVTVPLTRQAKPFCRGVFGHRLSSIKPAHTTG